MGRPKRHFWPLQLPTVLCTRFWKPPGSILGAILASKMLIFDNVVPDPVDSFVELIFHRCLLRMPSEICLLRALREKGTFGLRPTKTNGISCFCICAVPPATQQGRQQRTTYSIEIGPKNIQMLEKCSVFASRPGSPPNNFKMTLPPPPPGEENRPKTGPIYAKRA